ncbi:hypothetical protein GCM10022254_27540 [Actinomadura meridiana]|uniref:Uncharacterized protein n=1 Tax=Actinomadura meridiana TaxID=559626 RepID=A0ABP8BZP9_9ACTN
MPAAGTGELGDRPDQPTMEVIGRPDTGRAFQEGHTDLDGIAELRGQPAGLIQAEHHENRRPESRLRPNERARRDICAESHPDSLFRALGVSAAFAAPGRHPEPGDRDQDRRRAPMIMKEDFFGLMRGLIRGMAIALTLVCTLIAAVAPTAS